MFYIQFKNILVLNMFYPKLLKFQFQLHQVQIQSKNDFIAFLFSYFKNVLIELFICIF